MARWLVARSFNSVMPGKTTQEAVQHAESDRFTPTLCLGSVTAMVDIVHRVGGPQRSRVSLGEPPAFLEHGDLHRLQKAFHSGELRSTIGRRDELECTGRDQGLADRRVLEVDSPYAIFVNGSYGVGKTTVLDHIGNLLAADDRPFSLIDIDWFHRSWPVAAFDRHNQVIEAQNIAAVWSNYRAAGQRQLVMSGVIANRDDRLRYSRAVDLPVRSVRLTAQASTAEGRLRARYEPSRETELRWHLDRWTELAERQEAADLDEIIIATDTLNSGGVARLILQHFGLADPSR